MYNKFYSSNQFYSSICIINFILAAVERMAHQPLPAVVLARDFFTLQEERVRQYAALSASHREYLSTAPSYDIGTYQRAVADATKNFKEISERIIEMRTQFDEEFREKVLTLDRRP